MTSLSVIKKAPNKNRNRFLLMQIPTARLTLYFFAPDGQWIKAVSAKVSGLRRFLPSFLDEWWKSAYELKDRQRKKKFHLEIIGGSKPKIVITGNDGSIQLALIKNTRKHLVFQCENNFFYIQFKGYKIEMKKNDHMIATIDKGWMPLRWQQMFPANAPILTLFPDKISEKDDAIITSILYFIMIHR